MFIESGCWDIPLSSLGGEGWGEEALFLLPPTTSLRGNRPVTLNEVTRLEAR